jgi:predicted GNAT superfamily acetyltransferase
MVIRPLTTSDECRRVAALEREIWGYPDWLDVVPPPLLVASVKRGGILLGAFDGLAEMKGFVYAMPALREARVTQWSHMLGVTADARGNGIATRLKLAQRDHAIRMGIDLIEWTYDPLQAVNAHLNLAKLGTVAEEYEANIYGASSSPLDGAIPTDRIVARWNLSTPHVERRVQSLTPAGGRSRSPTFRDSAVTAAVLLNPSRSVGEWLEPGSSTLDADAARLLVEIPIDFTRMHATQPDIALEWRMGTRLIFQTYLGRGYRAVDFFLGRHEGRGQYLLARSAG